MGKSDQFHSLAGRVSVGAGAASREFREFGLGTNLVGNGGLSTSPNAYVGGAVLFTSGVLVGQAFTIMNYPGSQQFTLSPSMGISPTSGDTFNVMDPDPFDPRHVYPNSSRPQPTFAVYPLIYSYGSDRIPDIVTTPYNTDNNPFAQTYTSALGSVDPHRHTAGFAEPCRSRQRRGRLQRQHSQPVDRNPMMQVLHATRGHASGGARHGVTLLELLIVISILAATVATIPLMLSGVDRRKRPREAARLVSSYISSARARAIERVRPSGVMIVRARRPGAGRNVDEPGDGRKSAALRRRHHDVDRHRLGRHRELNPSSPTNPQLDNIASNVHVGDVIRFGYQGRTVFYLLGNGSQSAGKEALPGSSPTYNSFLQATDKASSSRRSPTGFPIR